MIKPLWTSPVSTVESTWYLLNMVLKYKSVTKWEIFFMLNLWPGHRGLYSWVRPGEEILDLTGSSLTIFGVFKYHLELDQQFQEVASKHSPAPPSMLIPPRQFCEAVDYNPQLQAGSGEACSWCPRFTWIWAKILGRPLSVLPLKTYPRDNLVGVLPLWGGLVPGWVETFPSWDEEPTS